MTNWTPHGPLAPEEQLYFLHIPKTAGTSLRTFLESHFDSDQICPHLVLPALLPVPPSTLAGYRLICGHHGLYLNRLLRRAPVTLTILRDPVERTISHFRHLQATKEDWLHEAVKGMTFEEFVSSDLGVIELLNFQTRHLAFDDIQEDFFGHSRLRTDDFKRMVRKYSDSSLADTAKQRLNGFAFVGLQERFADVLRLVSHTFGWAPAMAFASYNTAKAGFEASQLTTRAVERIHELTRIDREVYEHAATIFDNRLAQLTPEREEATYSAAMRRCPHSHSVSYRFDRAFNGQNWMALERAEGKTARWTGPGTSTTLDLPLVADCPLVLRFLAGAMTMDVIDSVRVFANDVELEVRWWQMHDPGRPHRTFEARIDPAALRRNDAYCRLRFDVARTVTPSTEWPGKADTRSLALYFFWLEVFPEGAIAERPAGL